MAVVSDHAGGTLSARSQNGAIGNGDPPPRMSFTEKYEWAVDAHNSLLCVGLDPDREFIPDGLSKSDFLLAIVEATQDLVCAFKPNSPFFEEDGSEGFAELETVIKETQTQAPQVPVILDSKRADIGNTSRFFARSVFDRFDADATVVNPYMGFDGLDPFVEYTDRHTFVLCRTSNAGARDFQDLEVGRSGRPLYLEVAKRTRDWGGANVGLVVGATYPTEARAIRELCPDMLFLVPGVGAQKAEVESVLRATGDRIIVNASRSILYAGATQPDYATKFAQYARSAAQVLHKRLNEARETTRQREGAAA